MGPVLVTSTTTQHNNTSAIAEVLFISVVYSYSTFQLHVLAYRVTKNDHALEVFNHT